MSYAIDLGLGVGYGSYSVSSGGVTVSKGGISAGLHADIPVGPVAVSPAIGYWSAKEEVLGISVTTTDIAPAVGVKLRLGTEESSLMPYFGVQLAYHMMSASTSVMGVGVSVSNSNIGAGALAGVAFKVAPKVRIPVQVGYDLIFEDEVTPGLLTIRAGAMLSL
jgi:outer membrane protein W